MRRTFLDLPHPLLVGHRGAAGERPENTLEGFRHAASVGADAVETDVHLTKDGVVVCLHDDSVDRTTNGRGKIADLDHAAAAELDAGATFTTDGGRTFPFRGRGVRVPALADCFDALPDLPFNVELKTTEPALVEGVLDLVESRGRAATTLLSSFHEETLRLARRSARRRGLAVAIGACEEESRRFVEGLRRGDEDLPDLLVLQVPTHVRGRSVVIPDLVRLAHEHGVKVYAWTVNDVDAAAAYLDMALDALVTDVPTRLLDVFAARRGSAAP